MLALALLSSLVASVSAKGVKQGQITDLVTFGDSYTDSVNIADGGQAWPIYAAEDGPLNLHAFARSGATCSNNLTFRPFPPLYESQIPTFEAEKRNGTLKLNEDKTIYTLWIGTNDVGVNSLLVGQGTPGVTLVDTTTCATSWVKTLYGTGARNFIFQNMIPLELVPLYSSHSYPNRYWTEERNTTAWSIAMREMTHAVNAIAKLQLQAIAPTLPGAHIAFFDSHTLFQTMHDQPSSFLNGTAPLNVTGAVRSCVFTLNEPVTDTGDCTEAEGTDRDSFLWFDELHPSEQADRIVGREIAKVAKGKGSEWAEWLS